MGYVIYEVFECAYVCETVSFLSFLFFLLVVYLGCHAPFHMGGSLSFLPVYFFPYESIPDRIGTDHCCRTVKTNIFTGSCGLHGSINQFF